MANTIDIVVPDLGDFSDVEIIELLVKPGDSVAKEDGLITLETDKAAMDVPAPEDGVVVSLTVDLGGIVNSGDVIGSMEIGGGDTVVIAPPAKLAADAASATTDSEAEPEAQPAAVEPEAASAGPMTLVVPDLGDFADVEVIEILVAPGDSVSLEDGLVTLETDKAAMDVPASAAGTVTEVLVTIGDSVSAGTPVVTIEASAGSAAPQPATEVAPAAAAAADTPKPAELPDPPAQTASAAPAAPKGPAKIDEAGFARAHASPSVRKLARELGVDLGQVKGKGTKGRILHDDVKAWVKSVLTGGTELPGSGGGLPKTPSVDFSKFGEIDVQPLTRIQKISGPRLQASWINIPHVTQHDEGDITELEAKRQELKGPAKERGIPLTPLAFIMKACVSALQEFPKVNSSLAEDGQHLVYKKYIHMGFAADTDQGLVVPVIRDADKKDVYELAKELAELSALAREGKLKAPQLQGASFTISSLGGIGGTAFTPIVNAPEVAILGVSRSSMKPVWDGEKFEPRLMLPYGLSYDHRVIDGALAARFTTFLAGKLADVDELLQAIP
ncbi:MAG: dihydrolipoyllysine-residue acetyltransferase [Pseudomonadota bacterium]